MNTRPKTSNWMALSEFNPQENWLQGGPVLASGYVVKIMKDSPSGKWTAEDVFENEYQGNTILMAALRCFVTNKLGPVIDVPDELLDESAAKKVTTKRLKP